MKKIIEKRSFDISFLSKVIFGILLIEAFLFPNLSYSEENSNFTPSFEDNFGGTLWQGRLPGTPSTGKGGFFSLIWTSKLRKIDLFGKIKGKFGNTSGTVKLEKGYNFENKEFTDTVLKTKVSVKAGYIGTDYQFPKVPLKTIAGYDPNTGYFGNTENKVKLAGGFSIMDSIKAAFGKEGWSKMISGIKTEPFVSAKVGGVGFKGTLNQNGELYKYKVGTSLGSLGVKFGKKGKTSVKATVMPFALPNISAGGGVNLQFVPMTPEEVSERNAKAKDLAQGFDKNFRGSLSENMGFGIWE